MEDLLEENHNEEKYGNKTTFLELVQNKKIVIPIIQRDYAQGRKDINKSKDIEIIRENFLQSLFDTITNNNPIVLDYIYGAEDDIERFQPIDGQQRLTTLFLLYWYFSIKDKKNDEVKERLLNFTYETRSSSTDFCKALVNSNMDISNSSIDDKISDLIIDCPWFYQFWQYDPTISAMLNMIDAIHKKFFEIENGFELLTRETNPLISFWTLSLEDFGLSDDLFIKMNARGKKLSKFENFKAKFEDNLDEIIHNDEVSDKWKSDIDNEWLDYFWKKYNNNKDEIKNVEIYMYRYILLVSEMINCKKPIELKVVSNFSVDCNYFDIINKVFNDENNVRYLCDAMNFLINLEESNCNYELSEVRELIDKQIKNDSDNLFYSDKAYLFACIDFCREFGYKEEALYKDYNYLIKKLISGQRTLRPNFKKYFTIIDTRNIGNFLSGIDKIISKLKTNKNIIDTLVDSEMKNITGISYLKHEIEKAAIINNSKSNSQSIQREIELFENNKHFKGMIHNVIEHEKKELLLSYSDFEKLMEQESELILRAITSFSFIIEDRYKGTWNLFWTEKDTTQQNAYYREVYYKKFLGFSPEIDTEEFGDILLTRDNGKIAEGVQAFFKRYGELKSSCPAKEAGDILKEIIEWNLKNNITPNSQQYYFVKHPEFITGKYNVYGSRPNYAIRKCVGDSYESGHYNPYQKAVSRIISSDNSIKVTAEYFNIIDRNAEELDFIVLSNGIKMFILPDGNWRIINPNKLSLSVVATKMIQTDILLRNDCDSIEVAVEFIKKL